MLDSLLQILSILGIILLTLLALLAAVLLLALFFPVFYRMSGEKDEGGLRIRARMKWLFGLLRVNWQYPEPGRMTVRFLWFKVYDAKIPADDKDEENSGEKSSDGRKASSGKPTTKEDKASDGKSTTKEDKASDGKPTTKEDKASDGKPATKDEIASDGKSQVSADKEEKASDGEYAVKGEKASAGKSQVPASKGEDISAGEHAARGEDVSAGKPSGESCAPGVDISSGGETSSTEEGRNAAKDMSSSGPEDTEQDENASGGKISQKIAKLKYTIRSIYDKIKKIWENIQYYIELLQEEDTKQLFSHVWLRLFKILKHIRPRHLRADVIFGTGSPDTTGYVYGVYCMVSSALGSGFCVTPDFERAVLKAEFEMSGHITLWCLLVNIIKLLLDQKLRQFIGKMKAGKRDQGVKASEWRENGR